MALFDENDIIIVDLTQTNKKIGIEHATLTCQMFILYKHFQREFCKIIFILITINKKSPFK